MTSVSVDDAALVSHIRDTHAHLGDMVRQHHEFTVTATLPIGDFLAHLIQWTGKPAGELLQVLRGSSDVSLGVAKAELAALASALNANAEAHAILNGPESASAIIKTLQAHPTIASPLKAYLDLVEVRCFGYDLCAKSLGEMPELIVRTIQSAVKGEGATSNDARLTQDRISTLRNAVPAEHQASFDALLEEAVFINRLRDERGHYSDGWAVGIARRALGEAGRRLVARGTFASADSAYDASLDEIIALLAGKPGPSDTELIARAAWRKEKTSSDPDIPVWLGAPPSPPPPSAWLPEKGRRADQAIGTFLGTMFIAHESHSTTQSVKGLSVSPGVYEGIARVVNHESEFGRIQQGDVLVTRSTSPYFNVVLPLLGAIVTDRGGQLFHAAIVAREYGIPAVVGTTDACKDGARVRVDGATGEVTVLA
ncbi:PEP-utilizing enzyme [Rhodoferax sp. PAMC 29310]|uniref:PEP-utilizing enzyme n=1 Tax=Rhodoferax sp. PAMC 29310 TaxID=2822760 RepID=UPI001B3363B1|nr:PEP-utilizing enzyme [Rhodoferax sp. PAMC 29310]